MLIFIAIMNTIICVYNVCVQCMCAMYVCGLSFRQLISVWCTLCVCMYVCLCGWGRKRKEYEGWEAFVSGRLPCWLWPTVYVCECECLCVCVCVCVRVCVNLISVLPRIIDFNVIKNIT